MIKVALGVASKMALLLSATILVLVGTLTAASVINMMTERKEVLT